MGCVGFTMPLLSTLAALVIIVHSAEENYEREFHMTRPRALDTQTNYDQPWRLVEIEPTVTQSTQITQSEIWDETDPEQSMRTRRRKRKRRPQIAGEDDLEPQERVYTYNEDSLPHLQENIERPRRRRKKIDFQNSDNKERQSSWNEEENRPKRRGHKRKRPLADSMSELSEFGGYREQTDGIEDTADFKEIQIDSIPDEENNNKKEINEKINSKVQIYNKNEPEIEKTTQPMMNYDYQPQAVRKNDDISLSEFSIESIRPNEKPNRTRIDLQEKTKEKGINISNNIDLPKIKPIGTDKTENILFNLKTIPNEKLEKSLEKIRRLNNRDIKEECYIRTIEDTFIRRDKEPLDPFTLKSLLKKSNGKSLSEILQQNNLSLADLLHGREKALSILKKESLTRTQDMGRSRNSNKDFYSPISSIENIETANNKKNSKSEKNEENEHVETETTTVITTTENLFSNGNQKYNYGHEETVKFQEKEPVETHRRGYLRRRFPGGIRRKLRTRPTENNTYKGQLSRDLIALSSVKYKNNRNRSKSREWKEIVPSMMEVATTDIIQKENETDIITTTPCPFTETTVQEIYETTIDPSYTMNTEPIVDFRDESETTANSKSTYLELEGIDIAQFTTSPVDVNTEQEQETITRKSDPLPIMKPLMNSSDLRRQALNNRLKRKRVKQRTSTTGIPEELEVMDTFGIGKFVSASKFITNTQKRTTQTADEADFTTLEDFLTTEATQKGSSRYRFKKPIKTKNTTALTIQKVFATTEETAKYEIDEILNDNLTSAKLSKILKERNMTLKELVEHRERGSSHVHLADIFHNASREPNPPEPFLSKSLIEPISKETYPLRALLEANLHDPRTTTIDPTVPLINNANIPVVMDFGNNVNENGENKGVISLFKNYSKPSTDKLNTNNENTRISYDMDDKTNSNTQGAGTSREARTLYSEKDSVTWNDLINLMQKNHQKENIHSVKPKKSDPPNSETLQKIDLEEDLDGDGVIVLDDLQQLRHMERKTSSDKLLDFKIHERSNPLLVPNNSYTVLSDTKSVTVATASIIGLALILFLLTYAILKWKQQNKIFHTKHAKEDEFVPTPVFESRKSHKINSSTRSKSPMLATQNIYSIDTINTHAGSESPEYMWDTLRKPFQ